MARMIRVMVFAVIAAALGASIGSCGVMPVEDYSVIHDDRPESLVAATLTSKVNETVFVLAKKDSAGRPIAVIGAGVVASDGKTTTILFGNDGLPVSIVDGSGVVVTLSNYTTDSVDMTEHRPDGSSQETRGVHLDSAKLSTLRAYAQSGFTVSFQKSRQNDNKVFVVSQSKPPLTLEQMFGIAGVSTGIFFCVGGIVGALPTGGLSLALGCGATVLSAVGLFTGNDAAAGSGVGVNIARCVGLGSGGACASAGLSLVTRAATQAIENAASVSGGGGAGGGSVQGPGNDDCSNAFVAGNGTFTGTNDDANTSRSSSCVGGVRDVWWRYVAPASGPVSISVSGSSFPARVTVFSSCNGAESCAALQAVQGTSYWIRVSGDDLGQTGNIVLTISQ